MSFSSEIWKYYFFSTPSKNEYNSCVGLSLDFPRSAWILPCVFPADGYALAEISAAFNSLTNRWIGTGFQVACYMQYQKVVRFYPWQHESLAIILLLFFISEFLSVTDGTSFCHHGDSHGHIVDVTILRYASVDDCER